MSKPTKQTAGDAIKMIIRDNGRPEFRKIVWGAVVRETVMMNEEEQQEENQFYASHVYRLLAKFLVCHSNAWINEMSEQSPEVVTEAWRDWHAVYKELVAEIKSLQPRASKIEV